MVLGKRWDCEGEIREWEERADWWCELVGGARTGENRTGRAQLGR